MNIPNAVTVSFSDTPLCSNRHGPRSARRKTLLAVALLCLAAAPAFAQLAATATIFAAPDGANFDYDVSLTNTGSVNIGTFWFAWTPPGMPTEYDFLPSAPFSISQPVGWLGPASFGFPGYSIEFYNSTGSLLAPGKTDIFHFTSPDSPTTLQNSTFGFRNTTSFIYEGAPEVGATAEVSPAFVPEPSTCALLLLGATATCGMVRRRR